MDRKTLGGRLAHLLCQVGYDPDRRRILLGDVSDHLRNSMATHSTANSQALSDVQFLLSPAAEEESLGTVIENALLLAVPASLKEELEQIRAKLGDLPRDAGGQPDRQQTQGTHLVALLAYLKWCLQRFDHFRFLPANRSLDWKSGFVEPRLRRQAGEVVSLGEVLFPHKDDSIGTDDEVTVEPPPRVGGQICLLLEGEAGTGKTSILRNLVFEQARRTLQSLEDDPQSPATIPVYVSAPTLKGTEAWPHDVAAEGPKRILGLAVALEWSLVAGRGLLLVDGMDEAAPSDGPLLTDRLVDYREHYGCSSIVVTSRPSGFLRPANFETLVVMPLGSNEQRAILKAWLPEEGVAGRILEEALVSAALRDLVGNPFLLTLLAWIASQAPSADILESRHLVLQRAVDLMLSGNLQGANAPAGRQRVGGKLRRLLAKAGYQLLRRPQARLSALAPFIKKHSLTNLAADSGLLREVRGGDWEFSHRSIAEFLAAEHLVGVTDGVTEPNERAWEQMVDLGEDDLGRWYPVFEFVHGRVTQREAFLEGVKSRNPALWRKLLFSSYDVAPVEMYRGLNLSGREHLQVVRLIREHATDFDTSNQRLVDLARSQRDAAPYVEAMLMALGSPDRFLRIVRALIDPALDPDRPTWVRISPGRFMMGADPWRDTDGIAQRVRPYSDEGPAHPVSLLSDIEMLSIPVTMALYAVVIGRPVPAGVELLSPVTSVTWSDANEFCRALERLQRRLHAIRLPTEAEWECACRAGTTSHWCTGDEEASLLDAAWFSETAEGEPAPVGLKPANPWGLFDMHGNVWEWCLDWYGLYQGGEVTNPEGPTEGEQRVVRGGSFETPAGSCRSSCRSFWKPEGSSANIGFRVVRVAADRGGAQKIPQFSRLGPHHGETGKKGER